MTNEDLNTFMRAAGFVPLVKYERVHPSFDRAATWRHVKVAHRGAYVQVERIGVGLDLVNRISIDKLFTPNVWRESGYAKSAMQALCAQADKDRITLKLYACNWLGVDLFDYIAWYSRFGFVSSKNIHAMERKPR